MRSDAPLSNGPKYPSRDFPTKSRQVGSRLVWNNWGYWCNSWQNYEEHFSALELLSIQSIVTDIDDTSTEPNGSVVNLVMTQGSMFMIAGGSGVYILLALVLIIILVAAWIAVEPIGPLFKSYLAGGTLNPNLIAARFLPAKRIPAQKNCPHCAKPTPISALFCEACDYNFLSGMVGGRQKTLPAPGAIIR